MSFTTANIDRAIVIAQYDLMGFFRPLGTKSRALSDAKSLDAVTYNFIRFAFGFGSKEKGHQPDEMDYTGYNDTSYSKQLAMCKQLAAACDESQKQAIQSIIKNIILQNSILEISAAAEKIKSSGHLQALTKDTCWGRTVLALAKAFKVKIKTT